MSNSFSEEDLKKPNVARPEGHRPELRQDVDQFKWDKFHGCGLCGCFSFVLQLVLLGSLGSFLFGFNISLLNTAVSAVLSDYQQCGQPSFNHQMWLTQAKVNKDQFYKTCMADELCKPYIAEGVKPADFNLSHLKFPGGYNDLSCDSLKWYNAILSCAILIGAAIGSMTGGRFMAFGRRLILLITMYIFAVGVVCSVVANSFSALLWARLIVGYAVGLTSVASPTYMSEVTPSNRRGTFGVFHQLFIVIGIFLSTLIGLPLINPTSQDDYWEPPTFQRVWWRVMLGLGLVPVLLGIYLFTKVYNFETPHYYVEQQRFKDAKALLQLIHARQDVDEELYSIIDNVREGEISKKNGFTFGRAFADPEFRRVIVIGFLLSAFQQFGGINVFMTSSNDLFAKAGLVGTMGTVMTIVMTLLNCVMTFPTLYLIEKMGRKSLMFMGSLGQFIAVVPAAIMYWTENDPDNPGDVTKWLAIVGVLGFVVFFALAYGPVLWVYLFEIYPMEIKDVAAGVATGCNWIAGIIMVFSAVVLPNQISYTLFAVLQLVGTLIIFFFMKETKGRAIGDSPFITKKVRV